MMEDSKKDKKADLMKKFEAMKQKHQDENSGSLTIDEAQEHTSVIPDRNFKKNLGCG